jgi:Arm DNA-binding domain
MAQELIKGDRTIQALKPGAGRLSDGAGLYLLPFLKGAGAHCWRFDYTHEGKRKTISLGVYPQVGLALARERADKARALVPEGGNPSQERQETPLCQYDLLHLPPIVGSKTDPHRTETLIVAALTLERDALKSRLDKALLVIDVQKNWPPCWAIRPTAPGCCDGRRTRAHPRGPATWTSRFSLPCESACRSVWSCARATCATSPRAMKRRRRSSAACSIQRLG